MNAQVLRPSALDKESKASELKKLPGLLGNDFDPKKVEYLILFPKGEDVPEHFVAY